MKFQILSALFILGLVYVLAPGPTKVSDFPSIPSSLKSDEPGDTYQVSNIAAFFSDFDREGINKFFKDAYRDNHFFGKIIPPINLSYPPEYARVVIRNEQVSTFLEEFVYPLRGSIFVNGYEPYIENEMKKRTHNFVGDHIHIQGRYFVSKTTLRFYPADAFARIIVYLGIWLSIFALFELSKKVLVRKGEIL